MRLPPQKTAGLFGEGASALFIQIGLHRTASGFLVLLYSAAQAAAIKWLAQLQSGGPEAAHIHKSKLLRTRSVPAADAGAGPHAIGADTQSMSS